MAAPFYNPLAELIDWGGEGGGWRLIDALSGSLTTGAIGGGKSSGPGNWQRAALLRSTADIPGGCGGVVFFAKNGEADEWEQACAKLGRAQDVVRIRAGGRYGFNFMDWIARWGEGGERGPIPTVALIEEIGSVLAPQGGGQNAFWDTALRIKLTNLVSLCQLAVLRVSLEAMAALASSAPRSLAETKSPQWQKESACNQALLEAGEIARGNPAAMKDLAAVRRYFLEAFATLDERPRSTIEIMFSQLVTPMLSRPLRPLLCEETNIWPEMAFDGKIFLVDLPVQEYGLTAKLAALAFGRCFQLAVMRRSGPPGSLRPVFYFADEAQNFIGPKMAEYQAVARSAGGITILLTQQISSIRDALGNNDKCEALTSNLQTKWFCQNTGVETNEWASKMIGERYVNITSINTGGGTHEAETGFGGQNRNTGASIAPQKRRFIEEAEFQKLRRGGPANKFIVDCVFFCGDKLFPGRDARGRPTGEMVPLKHLSFPRKVKGMRDIRSNIHFREAGAASKPTGWLLFPALSILPLIRRPVGYDVITPVGVVGNLVISFVLPFVLWFAAIGLFQVRVPPNVGNPFHYDPFYVAFIVFCAVAAIFNIIVRGWGLRRGAGIHSEEAGWSWVTLYVPLPPLLCELVLVPVSLAGIGWLVLHSFSFNLGAWLMVCAASYVCLVAWETRIYWRARINVVNDIKRADVYSGRVGDVQTGAAQATTADDTPYAMAGLGGGKTRRKPRPQDTAPDMAAWRRDSDSLTPDTVGWFRRGSRKARPAGLPVITDEP